MLVSKLHITLAIIHKNITLIDINNKRTKYKFKLIYELSEFFFHPLKN